MNKVRYIGKESNDLDEVMTMGIEDDTPLEFINHKSNEPEMKKFRNWISGLLSPEI